MILYLGGKKSFFSSKDFQLINFRNCLDEYLEKLFLGKNKSFCITIFG
jgi:hypothetical protein